MLFTRSGLINASLNLSEPHSHLGSNYGLYGNFIDIWNDIVYDNVHVGLRQGCHMYVTICIFFQRTPEANWLFV